MGGISPSGRGEKEAVGGSRCRHLRMYRRGTHAGRMLQKHLDDFIYRLVTQRALAIPAGEFGRAVFTETHVHTVKHEMILGLIQTHYTFVDGSRLEILQLVELFEVHAEFA